MRYFFTIWVMIAVLSVARSQRSNLEIEFGTSVGLNKGAVGYCLSMGYVQQIRNQSRHSWGVEIAHTFHTSDRNLPDVSSDMILNLRSADNPSPRGSFFGWGKESFPPIRFSANPNRYFNFNVGAMYRYQLYHKSRTSLVVGLGLHASWRDEMEIQSILKPISIDIIGGIETNVLIPVYQYNTYWDAGVSPQISYRFDLSKKMYIQTLHKMYLFPFSENLIYTGTVGLGFSL